MNTLRDLLHLTPDARHPRIIAADRLLLWGCIAAAAWLLAFLQFSINY